MTEFELELTVAKILATQFWNGTKSDLKMTKKEYFEKSLINWVPAARGIIQLCQGRKNED